MSLYTPLQPGDPDRIGPFRLLGRLGEGGMGVVFLGQEDDGEPVAIKTLRPALAGDPKQLRRFHREVEAAQGVPRFCTAAVYGHDFIHNPPYIVTEYVKGPSLAQEVAEKGPLSASELHGVAFGVAAALSGIHQAGIVHGDLTPSNVLLSPYGPRVIDFGIARTPQQTASSTGSVRGTPPYMAPEHFTGGPVTHAADVFAWGSVVAFAGTGRKPFGQGTIAELYQRIVHGRPDLEGLDPVLRELVEAALRKNPADRPAAGRLQEQLMMAARTVPADGQRTVEVDRVLENAKVGPDRPPPPTMPAMAPRTAPETVGDEGFGRPGTALVLGLVALVLALAVWVGSVPPLEVVVRWLVGAWATVLPLLVAGWAVAVWTGPRSVPLWPQVWEATWLARVQWDADAFLRAGWTTTWAVARSLVRAPALLALGSIGLLHLARDAPTLRATDDEWERAGGILGALLTAGTPRWLFVALLLLAGAVLTARAVDRGWGRWPAVLMVGCCLAVAAGPALYFNDRDHQSWVGFDAEDHLAAFTGLSVDGAEPSQATEIGFTRNEAHVELPELIESLDRGIPALDANDAQRLAYALADPRRFDRLASPQVFQAGGIRLETGQCLADAGDETGRAELCARPHAAEVYAVVEPPFRRFPDTGRTDALAQFGAAACQWQFQRFVGIEPSRSDLEPFARVPTRAEWDDGARTVACLLSSRAELPLVGSVGGSRRIFADYFPGSTGWSEAGDIDRCELRSTNGETLTLEKGQLQGSNRPGKRCIAVPPAQVLDPNLLREVRLSVKPRFDAGSRGGDRMGFVCRQNGKVEYHLTIARDGHWWIQKKLPGPGTQPLSAGSSRFPADRLRILHAVCAGGEDGTPVRLELWANNRLIGTAQDPIDQLRTGTVGVVIVADDPTSFVGTFDDFTVDRAA